ncbi:Single insulin-like growth factor-binding domain protein-2-like [Homarus americanus]|uniref:Single insulin-like growth factor-binding domain protein-2-like n=1 Tax=Homarus americanus TaxID=6706 RepID=A0A8J5TJ12_HOMAM|nr:Single insulin-like growth factor-binding domain protein-2-like [Homarus americanus]
MMSVISPFTTRDVSPRKLCTVKIEGLSCSCSGAQCSYPANCRFGIEKDACHCCLVCKKAPGEVCGGPFDVDGHCGDGLVCFKDADVNDPIYTQLGGICRWWHWGYDFYLTDGKVKVIDCSDSYTAYLCTDGLVYSELCTYYPSETYFHSLQVVLLCLSHSTSESSSNCRLFSAVSLDVGVF